MKTEDTALYEKIVTSKYTHRRLRTASISGGIEVTGWTAIGDNTYKATVPSTMFINQLFVNNQRIPRTRVPMNQSNYLQYETPLKEPSQAHYGFQYAPGRAQRYETFLFRIRIRIRIRKFFYFRSEPESGFENFIFSLQIRIRLQAKIFSDSDLNSEKIRFFLYSALNSSFI